MKILISPNSFKECEKSVLIAKKFFNNLHNNLKKRKIEFVIKAISDGGDGFLEVCLEAFKLNIHSTETMYPNRKP